MNKILVIVGPTAIGKTGLGIKLAKNFNGEIISADSRQVYKGMDIITGKDLPVNSEFKIENSKFGITEEDYTVGYYNFDSISIWLMDIVKPDRQFNVADYYELAWKVIRDIWNRKKLVVVVGGTGFYIKVLLEGIGTLGVEPDWKLRERLSHCSIVSLSEELRKVDPQKWESMNQSDRKNPRRLIRAIEVARNRESLIVSRKSPELESLVIGLMAPNETLYQRIDQRVEERLEAGAEREIKELLESGFNWENSVLGQTIGYREWQGVFEGKVDKKDAVLNWKFVEHDYARRQMTWFRKVKNVNWFDITVAGWEEKVEKLVKDWYI